jgi:hypothetical protein
MLLFAYWAGKEGCGDSLEAFASRWRECGVRVRRNPSFFSNMKSR